MSFQTCMIYYLLQNTKYILKNVWTVYVNEVNGAQSSFCNIILAE